jgi:hypothetical protein
MATLQPTINPILRDETWFKSQSCLSPCWHNLEIGQTSKEEAIKVVAALPFIESKNPSEEMTYLWDFQRNIEVEATAVKFFYVQPHGLIGPILYFVDDTYVGVFFSPNYSLTFKTVVESIGYPDYSYYRPVTPEIIDCEVNLIWVDRNLSLIYYKNFQNNKGNLCQEIRDRKNKIPPFLTVQQVTIMDNKFVDISQKKSDFRWNGFTDK